MRRTFTLIEMVMVIAVIAVLAALAIPALHTSQLKAKRVEIDLNMDGILDADIAYHAALDTYLPTTALEPRMTFAGGVGKTKVAWPSPSTFDPLGWRPDGDVYGIYNAWGSNPTTLFCSSGGGYSGYSDVDGNGTTFYVICCRDTLCTGCGGPEISGRCKGSDMSDFTDY
jgi:prepilin-type N-terminal cleavage/methylation domain-containing protein